ncbi:ArsR family transcriptional regulator [Thermococcus sp. GR7]|uniref:ArsR family transcriptional regulator n=1 Tax=unclassified Thermococcus TaxID=2627626 RepID=UPI00143144A6|nr:MULTISPECIES: ArsR family transcriptional regulator [unclassified Thermococcus]NJE47478.1 ArsR family transcriptional regulator [Thermococcus sp. GR7]NJE78594.1 ArsR family transcriptional regulator [Thermococcus sp. GR4]NJF23528.1 ArsR family transcriptional regulator [Thermococcus sp. GR5]
MPDDDLTREVQELRKALEELRESFAVVSQMAQAYLRLINLYAQYGGLGVEVAVPEVTDPIAREIVRILFDLKRVNVSQIARELKGRRGKASRNTVRAKLRELVELGIVVEVPGERGKTYVLSKRVVKRWLELIGMPIRLDQLNDY